ncbi:MAG: PAS domain-containing protein, partial [Dehalococcoidia bacterium]
GKPARQAVISDISVRKRAEEALREREETMLALLNAPTESALLADIDGTILAMNEVAAQRLGKSVDEIVGGTALDLMPPDVVAFRKAKGDEVGRSGEPCRFQDTRDGRWYDTTIYPIFDADGKVVRLAIFSSDITEVKEMEEALQKTREELDSKVERQMQRGDLYGLTYRELTVLHLVVAGSSDKEIGTTLGISTPTASKHITNILSKMHASSRTEAGVRALKEGLLD